MPPRRAIVTGASSGIGHAVAVALAERGYTVIGTCRDPAAVREGYRHRGVELRPLDLAALESIDDFAAEAGPVDVLINNAGESQCGPLEDLPMDAIQRSFRINVFGPVRLTQLLLPGMRERRYGRVVMIGSMLASFPMAYRSSYVAGKAAIKGFASAARWELAPYGVWISTVEPGSVNTGISTRRTGYLGESSPYRSQFDTAVTRLDDREATGIGADAVAATIIRAVESKRPKQLYAIGSKAPWVFALARLTSRGFVEKRIARRFGVTTRGLANH